ncbi:hypothetical protein NEIG_00448 [Nematocida sp. ERTm5]|nr:hypothetical protein NEIG_00448 [Nematocida sp. ERTm5]
MRTVKEKFTQSFLLLKRSLEIKTLPEKKENSPTAEDLLKKLDEIVSNTIDRNLLIQSTERKDKEIEEIKEGIGSLLKIANTQEEARKERERQSEIKTQEYLERLEKMVSSSSSCSPSSSSSSSSSSPSFSSSSCDRECDEKQEQKKDKKTTENDTDCVLTNYINSLFVQKPLEKGKPPVQKKDCIAPSKCSAVAEDSNTNMKNTLKSSVKSSNKTSTKKDAPTGISDEKNLRLVLTPNKSSKGASAEKPTKNTRVHAPTASSSAIPVAKQVVPIVIGGKIRANSSSIPEPVPKNNPPIEVSSTPESSPSTDVSISSPTFSNPESDRVEDKLQFISKQGTVEDDARLYGMITKTIEKMKERKDFEAIKMSMQMDIARKYIKDFIDLRIAMQKTQPDVTKQDKRNKRKRQQRTFD